jgi:phosphatidylglycerophosphate synthase
MVDASRSFRLIAIVPNVLSSLRLALAAWFPFSPAEWWVWIIIAGGLSDVADGVVARRFNATSTGGGLLDGAADKLFVLSALVTLTAHGHLAAWQMLLVICRDLAIGVIAADMARRREWGAFARMKPSAFGKFATLCQYLVMLAALLWPDWLEAVLVAAVALCVLAAGDYLNDYLRGLRVKAAEDAAA